MGGRWEVVWSRMGTRPHGGGTMQPVFEAMEESMAPNLIKTCMSWGLWATMMLTLLSSPHPSLT